MFFVYKALRSNIVDAAQEVLLAAYVANNVYINIFPYVLPCQKLAT